VGELYSGRYADADLDAWARRIRAWSAGGVPEDAQPISPRPAPRARERDVYCFFDNDTKAEAPGDARRLMARLGVAAAEDQSPAASAASTRASKRAWSKRAPPTS
jgi:uncharacterized protein YecE (DUF72 family)